MIRKLVFKIEGLLGELERCPLHSFTPKMNKIIIKNKIKVPIKYKNHRKLLPSVESYF